jgi:hypothetical protein
MVEFCGMEPSDFGSKLGGSIFRVNGEIFQLSEVEGGWDEDEERERDPCLRGMILTDRGREWRDTYYYHDDSLQIDISFPKVGYVNYKSGAVYVCRLVERQYKYGYNRRVVHINDRFQAERQHLGMEYNDPDLVNNPHFIARLFDRFFFSYDQALSLIRRGRRLGAALNPYVYIGRSLEFDKPVICYKDKVVGYIDGPTNFLFPEADYVGRLLPNFEVKEDASNVAIGFDWD